MFSFSSAEIFTILWPEAAFIGPLMSSHVKENIRDKLPYRLTGAVASARSRESAAIFS